MWVTQVDWPGHCPDWYFVYPPMTQLTVEWFGLTVDLLFWTFLFALILALMICKPKFHSPAARFSSKTRDMSFEISTLMMEV